eukprot:5207107-Pyramimonas_sp.AAC.1
MRVFQENKPMSSMCTVAPVPSLACQVTDTAGSWSRGIKYAFASKVAVAEPAMIPSSGHICALRIPSKKMRRGHRYDRAVWAKIYQGKPETPH